MLNLKSLKRNTLKTVFTSGSRNSLKSMVFMWRRITNKYKINFLFGHFSELLLIPSYVRRKIHTITCRCVLNTLIYIMYLYTYICKYQNFPLFTQFSFSINSYLLPAEKYDMNSILCVGFSTKFLCQQNDKIVKFLATQRHISIYAYCNYLSLQVF